MPQEAEKYIARVTKVLTQLLSGKKPDPLELPEEFGGTELDHLTRSVNRFISEYGTVQPFLEALSRGNLEFQAPRSRLTLLDCAKNLQANLRHLTWKTQQVAKGDLAQRVEFMGDFSESFNLMVHRLATYRDELLRKNSELEAASQTDSLTGLRNRRGIVELFQREERRADRSKKSFAIMLADIDRFKEVNDTYGHEAGDTVLLEIARVLKRQTRGADLCVRWGGEEFLTLLVETDLVQAVAIAERTRLAVASSVIGLGETFTSVTISIGLSIRHDGEPAAACIRRCDTCLYKAKESGRNQVWFSDGPEGLPRTIDLHDVAESV